MVYHAVCHSLTLSIWELFVSLEPWRTMGQISEAVDVL